MRCGVGDYTGELTRALSRLPGLELQVLTSRLDIAPGNDPAWVRRVMPSWRIGALSRFLAAVRLFKPDIVHVQYPAQGYDWATAPASLILAARMLAGLNVVATWHEYPAPGFTLGTLSMYALALVAKAVVAVRPEYSNHVRGLLAVLLGKTPVRFIPNSSVIPAVRLAAAERAEIRTRLDCGDRKLVSFFGFAYPHKGVEQLFEIANPQLHHLALVGALTDNDPYHAMLRKLAESERWRGKVSITGFVDPREAARLLAASDAAVFPFTEGGGKWNSSLHAASIQGTFVITTSPDRRGYAPPEKIYYAKPGDVGEMRAALLRHAGTRGPHGDPKAGDPWEEIARAHVELYQSVMSNK
jgi:glycosyltransferase involved in cell wall biosynthesis